MVVILCIINPIIGNCALWLHVSKGSRLPGLATTSTTCSTAGSTIFHVNIASSAKSRLCMHSCSDAVDLVCVCIIRVQRQGLRGCCSRLERPSGELALPAAFNNMTQVLAYKDQRNLHQQITHQTLGKHGTAALEKEAESCGRRPGR